MLMVTNLGARKLYFAGYRLIRYEKGEAVDVYVNDTELDGGSYVGQWTEISEFRP